jgi:pimeloyl-ACP methyl ester carboxylesterase
VPYADLFFVPGRCRDHTAFRPQFERFARTHAVTAVDLRGAGRSAAPDEGYSIRQLADAIEAFCTAIGIERPVVVGHSLGGMIAVELGARSPSPAGPLVLVDPGPIDPRRAVAAGAQARSGGSESRSAPAISTSSRCPSR